MSEPDQNPLSLFEFWPDSIFYTPVVLYWIFMGLKYRDFSIPTAANPRIETGGLCGESKSSILNMAGPIARQAIAPYALFSAGTGALERVIEAMKENEISFPVVIKPDIGCNGTGVKLVRDLDHLRRVLPQFPKHVLLIVQRLIDAPVEAGVFYIRHPEEKKGRITSITYKESPILTGDGHSTVRELVMNDPRMKQVPQIYLPRLVEKETLVLPEGETMPLVFAGNHCKGSVFRDGRADCTPELVRRLDEIMRDVPDFHFGRIDLKVSSIEALKRGEDFQIIEINGVGSEATHIWDRRTTLWEAYRAQFSHYRQSFLIGAANRSRGWKSSGALKMLKLWRKQKRLLASYPLND